MTMTEPLSREEALVRRYLDRPCGREELLRGIGDDAALLRLPEVSAIATDTMVAGVHLSEDAPARAWGHRALAVNLSDLAAMGAEPIWCTLALTLPELDEAWFADFAQGLHELAARHRVALVGGDLCSGPLSTTVTVGGRIGPGAALTRGSAREGDGLFITGAPGQAAQGLAQFSAGQHAGDAVAAYLYPEPRLAAGRDLLGLASSAIDVSDGLTLDLARLLAGSELGADLDEAALLALQPEGLEALAGGDDYELLFSLAPEDKAELMTRAARWDHAVRPIGVVAAAPGLRMAGRAVPARGWDHFGAAV